MLCARVSKPSLKLRRPFRCHRRPSADAGVAGSTIRAHAHYKQLIAAAGENIFMFDKRNVGSIKFIKIGMALSRVQPAGAAGEENVSSLQPVRGMHLLRVRLTPGVAAVHNTWKVCVYVQTCHLLAILLLTGVSKTRAACLLVGSRNCMICYIHTISFHMRVKLARCRTHARE